MSSRTGEYYQRELAWLQHGLRDALGSGPICDDPDVEWLREGVAAVAARMHECLDRATEGLIQQSAELYCPQALRTIPSATIVAVSLRAGGRQAPQRLAAGLQLDLVGAHGRRCRFRTTAAVELAPVRVAPPTFRALPRGEGELRLELSAAGGGLASVAGRALRLFVAGEFRTAAAVVCALLHDCVEVRVLACGRELAVYGPEVVQPVALSLADPGCGEPSCPGARLVQEYFLLPEKSLFVELAALECLGGVERCELVFRVRRSFEPGEVEELRLRTGCAPAINLFEAAASPIGRAPGVREHELRIDEPEHRDAEVIDVRSVVGLVPGADGRRRYRGLAEHVGSGDRVGPFYSVLRPRAPRTGAVRPLLQVSGDAERFADADREVLSVRLLACDGDLPAQLAGAGAWDASASGYTELAVERVAPLTASVPGPVDEALLWQVGSHLALELGGLLTAPQLRGFLALYAGRFGVASRRGRAASRKVEAVRAVEREPFVRSFGRHALHGVRCTVVLDDGEFAGRGDVYGFAAALREVFVELLPLNCVLDFGVALALSGEELRWPVCSGTKSL